MENNLEDRKQFCIFCLKPYANLELLRDGEPESLSKYASKGKLCKEFYVALQKTKRSREGDILRTHFKNEEDTGVIAHSMCDDCASLITKHNMLYREVECLQLRLKWEIKKLHDIIKSASHVPSRVTQYEKYLGQHQQNNVNGVLIKDEKETGLCETVKEFRKSINKTCKEILNVKKPVVQLCRVQHDLNVAETIDNQDRNSEAEAIAEIAEPSEKVFSNFVSFAEVKEELVTEVDDDACSNSDLVDNIALVKDEDALVFTDNNSLTEEELGQDEGSHVESDSIREDGSIEKNIIDDKNDCLETRKKRVSETNEFIKITPILRQKPDTDTLDPDYDPMDISEDEEVNKASIKKITAKVKKESTVTTTPWPCTYKNCKFYFQSDADFQIHLRLHGNFSCSVCNFSSNRVDKFILHEISHALVGKKNPKCPTCAFSFKSGGSIKSTVRKHFVAMHPAEGVDETQIFRCGLCSAPFLTDYQRWKHRRSVHKLKEWHCQHCDKGFSTRQKYKTHERNHPFSQSYKCPIPGCGRSFSRKQTLDFHLKGQGHMGKKEMIKCTQCDKSYLNKKNMAIHMKISHTTGNPPRPRKVFNHVCELCGKIFKALSEKALKRKIQIHEQSALHSGRASWQFSCELCGKMCQTQDKLEEHMRVHSKDKPFICEICARNFSIKYNLKRHLKLVHKIQPKLERKRVIYQDPHLVQ